MIAKGKAEIKFTGRIIHADGSVTELRKTWRSWPVIRQVRKWLFNLKGAK